MSTTRSVSSTTYLYLTFKELKLRPEYGNNRHKRNLYLTFKELKPVLIDLERRLEFLYLTY